MGTFYDLGARLAEERGRLQLNQTDFAEVAGVTRKTLFGYESGERAPDAGALALWAKIGADVAYVVTGARSFVPPPALSADERALIENYKGSSEGDRAAIRQLAKSVARSTTPSATDTAPARKRAVGGRK